MNLGMNGVWIGSLMCLWELSTYVFMNKDYLEMTFLLYSSYLLLNNDFSLIDS